MSCLTVVVAASVEISSRTPVTRAVAARNGSGVALDPPPKPKPPPPSLEPARVVAAVNGR
jgi:hypothetical protein